MTTTPAATGTAAVASAGSELTDPPASPGGVVTTHPVRSSPDRAPRAWTLGWSTAGARPLVPGRAVDGAGPPGGGVRTGTGGGYRDQHADAIRVELTLAWVAAGVCLLIRPGLAQLGRLVSLASWLGAVAMAAAVVGTTGTGATGNGARFVATVAPALLMAVGVHFLLSVPDGRLGTRARIVVVVLAYSAGLGSGLGLWFGPGRMSDPAAVAGWLVAVVVGLVGAERRYRSSPGVDRQRLQWIASGAVSTVEVGVVVVGLYVLVRWPVHPWAIAAGGTVLVPLGVALTSFRRTTGRIGPGARVAAHDRRALGGRPGRLRPRDPGLRARTGTGDRQVLGLSILAAAVVALGASVSHHRAQRVAQRLVYGTDDVPDDVVKTFSTRLTRAVAMDELLLQLAESLHKSMVLTSAEVWTGSSEVLERSASVPDRGPGRLHLGPRGGAPWWPGPASPARRGPRSGSRRAHRPRRAQRPGVPHHLLRRAARADRGARGPPASPRSTTRRPGAHRAGPPGRAGASQRRTSTPRSRIPRRGRRQADELRASRARIVAAADAERRRIERDLHDGAQQHLVALAVNVRLARELGRADPEARRKVLDQIGRRAPRATVQELRDLAHGIYPPLLMDRGLPEALRAAAARARRCRPRSSRRDRAVTRPTVEAAVYFCCLEALQNAGKHAGEGARGEVRVWEDEGALLFEVADTGAGFDAESGRGPGTAS